MTETWGMLQKSQIDSETIEEAIDRIVASHETDPDSHLGEGESLQSHKASEIIDHVVGSVVADKLSHSDQYHFCSFESLDNWNLTGSTELSGWPGVRLSVEPGVSDFSRIRSTIVNNGDFMDWTKTIFFQSSFFLDSEVAVKFFCGLGYVNSETDIDGFGFWYYDGDVKGYLGNGSTLSFTSAITVDPAVPHVYRAQWDPEAKTCYFFIDGVQVGTLSLASTPSSYEPEVFFQMYRKSYADYTCVTLQNVMISKSQ